MDSCECEKCKNCCKRQPGMGTPEELIKAAQLINLPLKDFLKQFCVKGWRENALGHDEYIKVAYPAKKGWNNKKESYEYPWLCGLPCVFLDKNEKCEIHDAKPTECKEVFGCKPTPDVLLYRNKVLEIWENAWKTNILPKEIIEFLED